jgi:putative ATPase
MDLFESAEKASHFRPLTEIMRPQKIDEILGQKNIQRWIQGWRISSRLPSLILWGPPGSGKTSYANCLILELGLHSESLNAIDVGSKRLKELGLECRDRRLQLQKQTVVFVDEIHRLNKSQQDILLPYVEKADFILIGATTENPSYRLNKALLSRCQLVVFESLSDSSLLELLKKGAAHFKVGLDQILSGDGLKSFIHKNYGDARRMLSEFEILHSEYLTSPTTFPWGEEQLAEYFQKAQPFDRGDDDHYDTISAFIKSMRGSDPDAALYYLARMLKGGEDPLFIARRMLIFASEDVGNADPRALSIAVAASQAAEMVGLPEAAINLAQAVVYLSSAPKSNKSYLALKKAQAFVEKSPLKPVPLHLRSAQTSEMKDIGYGVDYKYPHDHPKGHVSQSYFPEGLDLETFYVPSERGFEKNIKEYLDWLKK